ncbi:MAG: cell division protein FtsZ [Rhodospirillales bacterium]|nr:cell division protein FtsZ [Rhodospirillales bacterium]
MAINLSVPETGDTVDLAPKITVIGVGGAGGNAVNNMIDDGLQGVEFVVANTDNQALAQTRADRRIQLGHETTQGLGAGSKPEVGSASANESLQDITDQLKGSNMVFVAAGMGGGTGTGAGPVIACAAREMGILTVGVVTKPFQFEGTNRMRIAEEGITELQKYVDTLIVIPNQNLFRIANEKTTFADAFKMADDVLSSGVRSVTDLIVNPGLINLDFADIESVMAQMGKAMMGTGVAEGESRALQAAEIAISNPLLEDSSISGARRVLINITGGADMTLYEVDEATNRISKEVDGDAHIIVGSAFDPELDGQMRISVVATGIDGSATVQMEPRILDHRVVETTQPTTSVVEEAPVETIAAEAAPVIETPIAPSLLATDTAPKQQELAVEATPLREVPKTAAQDKPFIPPAPVKAPTETGISNEKSDAFAMAEVKNAPVNEPVKSEEKRGPSLFERVTGSVTGANRSAKEASPQEAPKPSIITGGADQGSAKPKIAGLTPSELPITSRSDDELLDIPAFLRRQAN